MAARAEALARRIGSLALDKKALDAWWKQIDGWRAKDCLRYKKNADVIMPQYAVERLYELTKDIESIHQKSIDAFIDQNRSLAIDAIASHRKFQRKISDIRSSIEQKNQLQIDLLDLIYMFERVSRSWADVADLVKPVY